MVTSDTNYNHNSKVVSRFYMESVEEAAGMIAMQNQLYLIKYQAFLNT